MAVGKPCTAKVSTNKYHYYPHTGVSLAVNEPVNMTEGDVQEVCVNIESTEQSRERLIPVSLTFIPKTSTASKIIAHTYHNVIRFVVLVEL